MSNGKLVNKLRKDTLWLYSERWQVGEIEVGYLQFKTKDVGLDLKLRDNG